MENTKEKIIKNARDLFTNYGYKKVSVDEIARKSSVTKKTIYSYFRDKEDLLVYLVNEEKDDMKKIIENQNISSKETFFDEVNKTLYTLLKYRKENKLFITLSKEATELNALISKKAIDAIDTSVMNYIKDKLVWAIDKGYIKECDINLCAFIIYKIYVAVMFEWEEKIDERKVTDNVIKFLKTGLFN